MPAIDPPHYIRADAKGREQFLSEIGSFTPPQREIFHLLCKCWQAEIPYKWFVSQIRPSIKQPEHELAALIEKLASRTCAFITIQSTGTGEQKDTIVLANPGDTRYHHHRLSLELSDYCRRPEGTVPVEKNLHAKNLRFPAGSYETLQPEDLSALFKEGGDAARRDLIYRIPLAEVGALYLVPRSGARFMNACLVRLRLSLGDPQILAEIARIRGTSMGEIRNRCESRNLSVWLDLVRAVHELESEVSAHRRVDLDEGMCQAAACLRLFIAYHIEAAKKRRHEQEEREKDLDALALQIRSARDPLVSQELFNDMLKTLQAKYGEEFGQVKEEFSSRFLETREKVKLPVIITIDAAYIHRDNFHKHFSERFWSVKERVRSDYERIMDALVRTRNRDRVTLFHSRAALESDMAHRIKLLDGLVAETLEKPRLLAEAIIHHFRETRGARDTRELKGELEKYFLPDSMIYRNLSAMFAVNAYSLFENAFGRLSFWHQLWIKVTGKYQSYREQFIGLTEFGAASSRKGALAIPRILASAAPELSADKVMRAGKREAAGRPGLIVASKDPVSARRKALKKPALKVKPPYSKREQQQAWESFGESLGKTRK